MTRLFIQRICNSGRLQVAEKRRETFLQGLKCLCENSFLPRLIERGISFSTICCGRSIKKVNRHTDSKALGSRSFAPRLKPRPPEEKCKELLRRHTSNSQVTREQK